MSKHSALQTATTTALLRVTTWRDTILERIAAGARRSGARRGEAGQTSVEYLGIIAVVVLIVAAIAGTNIGQTIYNAIVTQIAKVAK